MAYRVKTGKFDSSEWICGENSYLETAEKIKSIPGAEWIWPQTYARVFIRKYFTAGKNEKVRAEFVCDNEFELYINGMKVCGGVTGFEGDITEYVREGENRLNIRAYQTADYGFFTSAICGVIKVGEKSIFTDGSWQSYLAASFWENSEPDFWQELDPGYNMTKACPIHPRLFKRSLYMRKRFTVNGQVIRAVLCTTSRGLSEMYLNGMRTDPELFSQGISEKYREYHTADVTSIIRQGDNMLGAITANGWYNSESHSQVFMNKPCLRAELEITYRCGKKERTEVIGTDGSWLCRFSPYTDNDIQFGERYDARLEAPGWCHPGSSDTGWHNCVTVPDSDPEFTLRSYPPVVVKRRILPRSESEYRGQPLFDFGENCAGRTVSLSETRIPVRK